MEFRLGARLAYVVNVKQEGYANGNPWPPADAPSGDTLYLLSAAGALVSQIIVPPALLGGMLQTTPYATYLVQGGNIGIVTVVGTALQTIIPMQMIDSCTTLFSNTLVAIDQNRVAIFGRYDKTTNGTTTTETWLYILQAGLAATSTLDQSVAWSEKIAEGVPTVLGCMRDPSKPGRIVGHYGGSLFQIDTQRPWCIERWTPSGMTCSEALEHIGQVFAAIPAPDAVGVMHMRSRGATPTPTNYNVDQIKVDTTWGWKDYYSIVRVTSSDGTFYYDAAAQNAAGVYQQGGKLMTVSNQPMIWSLSGAAGMAAGLIAWFGTNRGSSKQSWFYPDPTGAAPWESILPFDRITINGGTQAYRVMSLDIDYVAGACEIDLLTD
jgi:hypothetical protein